ncbi:hypothetical protein GII33_17900 [Gordonia pseudamarae]|uniref:Uncharacterized protein n=1 Tax=Gordonia pseudamarae TaxID=2831662 RepID=A0ABX6IMA9_9ACTN|nr:MULTISPECIES: hypothetical protein [Gordonia]MBD0021191.1 hypothetical protein [Gordonia sp. (in: high G+C Gram-positive bacteria)]QHN27558.1 hypothetical protein GII33_17900 [Gordonia pseudamarae]QHN36440.1 hypothetical protein GII31_17675 [Gordonia pseudamarae]
MAKVGKLFTILGILIMLVSVVVGVIFAVTGFGKVADMADNAFVIEGSVTRQFDAGDEIFLFGQSSGTDYERPNCRFDGPAPTTTVTSGFNTTFTYDGRSVKSYQGVGFTESGSYTITCDSYAVATSEISAAGIFQSVGGVLLTVFGGGAGAFLAVVGGILWIIGASRKQPPTTYPPAASGGYPNYPPPGGYPNYPQAGPGYPPADPGGYPVNRPPDNWNR